VEYEKGVQIYMMRSMFSGVSGIKSHQIKMDVIGNNISNVNTVGFKASAVTFQEIFSQTLRGSGAPDEATGRGGTNPMQIGLGIAVSAIDTVTARGSVQRTDNPTDLSISGDGFFVIGNGVTGEKMFSRAGNFSIDKDGNLVAANGFNVFGWMNYNGSPDENGTYNFDVDVPVEPINVYSDRYNGNKKVISAMATNSAQFQGNLNATNEVAVDDEITFMVPFTVYDTLGHDYKLNINMIKTESNEWTWNVSPENAEDGITCENEGTISFTQRGLVSGVNPPLSAEEDKKTQITIDTGETGSEPIVVDLDFSQITQFNGYDSVRPSSVNGNTSGSLINFSISTTGIITGIYDNGQQQPLGQLSLAGFKNPAGLQKVGENMYIQTTNSGAFENGVPPGNEGTGTISPGTLEMSNVDLSKEFTDMITTQRGFQANGRIITSSDEMLQELVNLKR